ncbi:MAG: TolC family protein [Bacteroidales bacterium]|nr:TolC family protein [Bacteroidales bacterium]
MKKLIMILTALLPVSLGAQQTLSLQDCRDLAVRSSKELDQARIEVEMAGYDRKIALANYFPEISANGAYLHNNRDIALVSNEKAAMFTNFCAFADQLLPVSGPINAIAGDIDKAMHPDIHDIYLGGVSLKQPVFVGGKIVYSNQMAALAEELAESKLDQKYADIIVDVDQAYWQIVSISNKKKLAESYSSLLHKMQEDVRRSVEAGVATESDELQIKVKANEADMLLTKSTNGLELAKMLLCKRIGLPLDSDIILADEESSFIPVPELCEAKDMEQVYADRPETRSLSLAGQVFERKAKVARADMLPKVALTANYFVNNPNCYDGFQNKWNGGMLSAGVVVSVPIFHGMEATNKYRKAKAEARLYGDRYDDAKDLIRLQVAKQRKLLEEAAEKLSMSESNLANAEENLRKANVGYEAGVTSTETVLGAQTAWLSAHGDYIDAGIELQMAYAMLQKAEGNIKSNE